MEVKWSRDFSIKNMQLDKQHELIFEIAEIANDLALKIQDNDVQHKNDLKQILTKLFQYVKFISKMKKNLWKALIFL